MVWSNRDTGTVGASIDCGITKQDSNDAADGGLKDKTFTFGPVVDWGMDDAQTKLRGPVDVSTASHNSLRPEISGAWAGLKLLDMPFQMRPQWCREDLNMTVHADNDEAIKRARDDVDHCCATK